jgi:hypothetical protein
MLQLGVETLRLFKWIKETDLIKCGHPSEIQLRNLLQLAFGGQELFVAIGR